MNKPQSMDAADRLSSATRQLDLVLSFFPRVDGKLSVILGLNLAMLGVLTTRAPAIVSITGWMWACIACFLALCVSSLVFLYRGSFPQLDGGSSSLVYFREIANKRESDFLGQFKSQSLETLADDVLGQAWRNSKILTAKFDALKLGYRTMGLSSLPWAAALALFSMASGGPG